LPGREKAPEGEVSTAGWPRVPRFAVGDSIVEGIREPLEQRGVTVNARVGRNVDEGLEVLHDLALGAGAHVFVMLGTNGGMTVGQRDELAAYLRRARVAVCSTVIGVPHASVTNDRIRRLRRRGVHVLDWAIIARNRPAWFYSDGYHPSPVGRVAWCELVLFALGLR
jgi:lysophospholipase L1-like esterase